MSLYSMLFGVDPNADVILAILGLKKSDIERFRDCGFTENGIMVYTRTGGWNRHDYPNEALINNLYYSYDEDDNFDSTYATYYFNIPEEIKEDVEKFKKVREYGITGKLIKWVLKTLERKETEQDKFYRLWEHQNKIVNCAKYLNICESNGHTVVPLDDETTEKLLKLMEEVNGKQLSYSVLPYKIKLDENALRWSFDKDKPEKEKNMCRIKIEILDDNGWQVDQELWNRWKLKYSEKYPKAIKEISEYVEDLL